MSILANKILDALGGSTAVSRKTEIPLSTVHSWRKSGIPGSRLAHLRLIAEREAIAIDWETGERLDHVDGDISGGTVAASGKLHDVSAQAVSA